MTHVRVVVKGLGPGRLVSDLASSQPSLALRPSVSERAGVGAEGGDQPSLTA